MIEGDNNKLKLFGRFPKTNFNFDTDRFVAEYMKIISTPELTDVLLDRMIYRYNVNELKKAAIMDFVKNNYSPNLSSEKLCQMFECDKNTIFAIGQELEVSIRLFIQKKFYNEMGRNEKMIDEFGFTPRTFNHIYKRGYMTKSATIEAYRNGYITNEKVRSEIAERLVQGKSDMASQNGSFIQTDNEMSV